MARIVLPDTSLLRNFDEVSRIDLIEMFCEGQAPAWADQVAEECRLQNLDSQHIRRIFGRPIRPSAGQQTDALKLRQDFFPAKHLDPNRGKEDMGECITFAIWATEAPHGDIFFMLTEDNAVVRFCHRTRVAQSEESAFMNGRRAVAVTTTDLLGALMARQIITQDVVLATTQAIRHAGRPLIGRARDITI